MALILGHAWWGQQATAFSGEHPDAAHIVGTAGAALTGKAASALPAQAAAAAMGNATAAASRSRAVLEVSIVDLLYSGRVCASSSGCRHVKGQGMCVPGIRKGEGFVEIDRGGSCVGTLHKAAQDIKQLHQSLHQELPTVSHQKPHQRAHPRLIHKLLQNAGAARLCVCVCTQVVGDTEVVYTRVAVPKAVLLLFHGCSHSARDWGANSSSCSGCLGARAFL